MDKFMSLMPLIKMLPLGAIFGVVKWYLGFRVKISSVDVKNLELLDKLNYESAEAKHNFVRSSIFTIFTKRTTCIHHINLMFNSYDPRRLLMIYSKAPGFVAFTDNGIIKPKKLDNMASLVLLCLLISLMILAPVVFLITDYYWPTPVTAQYYKLLGLFLMLPFTFYGIRELIFLVEVLRYYKDKNLYAPSNN